MACADKGAGCIAEIQRVRCEAGRWDKMLQRREIKCARLQEQDIIDIEFCGYEQERVTVK